MGILSGRTQLWGEVSHNGHSKWQDTTVRRRYSSDGHSKGQGIQNRTVGLTLGRGIHISGTGRALRETPTKTRNCIHLVGYEVEISPFRGPFGPRERFQGDPVVYQISMER